MTCKRTKIPKCAHKNLTIIIIIKATLNNIESIAKEQYELIKERLRERSRPIDDRISRNNLPLWKPGSRTSTSKEKMKLKSVKTDCQLFSKLYIGCQVKTAISMIIFVMKINGLILHYWTVGESGQVANVTWYSAWINWWAQKSTLTHRLWYWIMHSAFRCSSHNSVKTPWNTERRSLCRTSNNQLKMYRSWIWCGMNISVTVWKQAQGRREALVPEGGFFQLWYPETGKNSFV